MFYLGIDVAKAKLDCSLLLNETSLKRKSKKVTNSQTGFTELLTWLVKQDIKLTDLHVTMEATGIYHEQAAQALHDAGARVSIVNPVKVKSLGSTLAIRTKTDGVDSFLIARFGLLCKPDAWVPPAPEVRVLKAFLARQEAISEDLQRERNRQEKIQIVSAPERVHKSLSDSINFLQMQLKQLQQEIDEHIDRHSALKEDLDLLKSIRAIGPQVGKAMLSVMQTHSFKSAEQLAAYLGLVPVERQSGSSVFGRARLSKAGPPEIRAKLYMAAIVAIRYNTHVKALYERLRNRGKSSMSALGACMRKLVHLCFGVLKSRMPYDENYANIA
ncbi:IS110 family transposase [Mycoavidus sp. HKI]|uniref:IS110 family transposase n=1 Tax=Mycoavidus sp. HKI TaxID=2840467 RepID=UPI001CC0A269|nr:IS110 family transposase [Mycoavidus sp. HKI]UAW63381.1 IS110 family transposase [Mycoavidus sp. HKI]